MQLMKKLGLMAGMAGLLLLPVQGQAQEEEKEVPKYIGAENCGKCHKSAKKGNQLGMWQESQHSKAYATLASEEAKAIAKEKGIEDPQKAEACLKCHGGVDAALIEPVAEGKKGYSVEEGVGCEACHGPGSLYKSRKIMKDKEASMKVGLIIPDEKTCIKCHNEESPTFKEFKYAEMLEKVAHPYPVAEGEGE